MGKGTDSIILREAINILKISTDQYSVMPHTKIMRIQEIIRELEELLEEER